MKSSSKGVEATQPIIKRPAISHGDRLSDNPTAPTDLVECLMAAAQRGPNKGIVYVRYDGSTSFQSYPELLDEARSILTGLRNIGLEPGSKVILQLDDEQEFISVFWACILGGFVPVPISAAEMYGEVNSAVKKLHNTWTVLDRPLVVACERSAAAIRALPDLFAAASLRLEITKNLKSDEPARNYHAPQPEDLAILLLTSGSTGGSKAVTQSHRALLHRFEATAQMHDFTAADVFLNWLPIEHVGGIVRFHLGAAYLGCQQIQVATNFILADPPRWLELTDRYRATMTWAPNFAYGLVNAAARENRNWDLSSMRFIMNGGETIVAKTARRFLASLIPFGLPPTAMRPAWGMSETSSAVTYSNRFLLESTSDDDAFIEVGMPIPGVSLRIVDASDAVIEEGKTGSLQVKGIPVTQGYYNDPKANSDAFTDDGWFRTGDLGFLCDGRLTITGRENDVIIVNGVNYGAHLVEAAVEELDGVDPSLTAACAVRVGDSNTDQLAVFFHPQTAIHGDLTKLLRAIRQKVVEQAGINPDYLLPVDKETIPKSAIGKIQRLQLSQRFHHGDFDSVVERVRNLTGELQNLAAAPAELRETDAHQGEVNFRGRALERSIAAIWCEVLNLRSVTPSDNFFECGGNSLLAARVVHRIREGLGVQLSLRALFDAPTVSSLANVVERGGIPVSAAPPPLRAAARNVALPLSFSQQRLWFLEQWHPDSAVYNVPVAYRLTGSLNAAALHRSINEVAKRHESLRTFFTDDNGDPLQRIAAELTVPITHIDVYGRDETEREREAQRLVDEEAHRPFDLTRAPLVRALLLRLAPNEHILVLTLHHLVSDGWSLDILNRELSILYNAFSKDEVSPLPTLERQYADYAVWQREWLKDDLLESQLHYWKHQLEGIPPSLELPFDRPRPAMQTYQGARTSFQLSQQLTQALLSLSHKKGVTLFMTLLAAFQVLLHRYSAQEQIVVGSPIAGRNKAELESLIGFFVNTMVLRGDLSGNPTFAELLHRVREVALDAYAHQDLPFEKLVEDLQPERSLSLTPLFQVLFSYQNVPISKLQLSGMNVARVKINTETTMFDLTLTLVEESGRFTGSFEYNTDLFDAPSIERMIGHFQILLEAIVANPDQRLSELRILTASERRQLLVEWNDNRNDYPEDKCIHQLFEAQVVRTPDAIALVFREQQLTYRDLNSKANQVAHYLRKLGIVDEGLVGICMERSPEMIIALLGILKAGGAYVPLDPKYPAERVQFMLQDTQARVLITEERFLSSLTEAPQLDQLEATIQNPKVICFERDCLAVEKESAANLEIKSATSDLAYVIYTSGSTGVPKGVAIEHRNAAAFLSWAHAVFTREHLAGVLASTSICFDLSVFEVFAPLTCGGAVILTENILSLSAIPSSSQLTLLNTVPSALNEVLSLEGIPSSVRVINLAGEPLRAELVRRIYQSTPARYVYDLYGPSECTTYSTWARRTADGPQTIGRPIANTQIYLLDGQKNPVPVAVVGEIYIAGAGVARGYLNRPELTAESFITHSFDGEPARRLYKTGDRARYLPNGDIEFLGRIDGQVKIRGYRIELGEIEVALAQHSQVREAVVIVTEDDVGDKQLVAYIVSHGAAALNAADLSHHLKKKLPAYMVPGAFVFLDALPLTSNGKVDRNALSDMAGDIGVMAEAYVAPRNPVEENIAAIWSETLGKTRIGVHDNFFNIGGHSLKATQVLSRMRVAFHSEIPLRYLFEYPTIAELAATLASIKQSTLDEQTFGGILSEIEAITEKEAQLSLESKLNN